MTLEGGQPEANGWGARAMAFARLNGPGIMMAALIALASQFVAEHYGAPAMLMALLFGIALNFLSETGRAVPGINFAARTILRAGVALLGLQISFSMLGDLGLPIVAAVLGSVVATIAFGMLVSRFFGFRYRFAFLSAGSVAICGASAALAIAAVLPKDERSEDRLVFTVVGVTVLSTLAMIIYPILVQMMGMDDKTAGIFLGATIHDVAQVVGAGFSISDTAGENATMVKLLRVALLAPVVLTAAIVLRRMGRAPDDPGKASGILPGFLIVFVVLCTLSSFSLIPAPVIEVSGEASRWMLLSAIGAVGLKTRPADIVNVGLPAVWLLLAETLFLAGLILLTLTWLGP